MKNVFKTKIIHLEFFEPFDQQLMHSISSSLKEMTGLEIIFSTAHESLTAFYDATRRQYNADLLLDALRQPAIGKDGIFIGMVNVDLFIPIFTYIFGQGVLGGNRAIVSIYRLRSEFYGLASDPALLVHRTIKVIVHELGHILGLYHCPDPACVMRSSTYVEDLDQKGSFFCDECIRKL